MRGNRRLDQLGRVPLLFLLSQGSLKLLFHFATLLHYRYRLPQLLVRAAR